MVLTGARWVVGAALLATLASLTACSSALDVREGGQPSMPTSIVVDFRVGVPRAQALAEVKRCHPLGILGSDAARSHGHPATSIMIWGPQSGTARASALYKCLKAAAGVGDQNWAG